MNIRYLILLWSIITNISWANFPSVSLSKIILFVFLIHATNNNIE